MKNVSDYKNALKLLGVRSSASQKELQIAYRKCANLWHPDRFQQSSKEQRAASERRMRDINKAYELLLKYHSQHGHLPGYEAPVQAEQDIVHRRENDPVNRTEHEAFKKDTAHADKNTVRPRKSASKSKLSAVILILVVGYYIFYMPISDNQESVPTDTNNQSTQQLPGSNKDIASNDQNSVADTQQGTTDSESVDTQQYLFSHKEKSAFDRSAFETKPEADKILESFFTYGDPPGKVYEVQGVPSKIDGDIWYYGKSEVHFSKGRVTLWLVIPPDELKVKLKR